MTSGDTIAGRSVDWTLSIVSHGHGASVNRLLEDLDRLLDPARFEVVVTVNRPESTSIKLDQWRGPRRLRVNPEPAGFGANHNRALLSANGRYVAALDPDLRLGRDVFAALEGFLGEKPDALVAPQVRDSDGDIQDNARRVPTPLALLRRYARWARPLDYPVTDAAVPVEWIAGLFMATARSRFSALGGFDERYHLYCEDVELSLRYWNRGGEVWSLPVESGIHDPRRQSLRNARHLLWHSASFARLWTSPTFHDFLRRRPVT